MRTAPRSRRGYQNGCLLRLHLSRRHSALEGTHRPTCFHGEGEGVGGWILGCYPSRQCLQKRVQAQKPVQIFKVPP